jgi:hypothetical protein
MTTFVSDDPQAGSHETGPKGVNRPKGEVKNAIEERVR